MKVVVIGAGSWGTAFVSHLAQIGHSVWLWGRDDALMKKMTSVRENEKYLSGVKLPRSVKYTSTLETLEGVGEALFLAVPSYALPEVSARIADCFSLSSLEKLTWVSLTKGVQWEEGRILTPTEMVAKNLPEAVNVLALTGPSHAEEVARGIHTAVLLGGKDTKTVSRLQQELSSACFRVYASDYVREIQIAGAVKNILAVAEGITYGLANCGDNTRGALFARGLSEMLDLFDVLGLNPKVWIGLSGIGDLKATGGSPYSRNRKYGEAIGKGESPKQGKVAGMVVEGYYTANEIRKLKEGLELEMPIVEEVYQVLYHHKTPQESIKALMERPLKKEEF